MPVDQVEIGIPDWLRTKGRRGDANQASISIPVPRTRMRSGGPDAPGFIPDPYASTYADQFTGPAPRAAGQPLDPYIGGYGAAAAPPMPPDPYAATGAGIGMPVPSAALPGAIGGGPPPVAAAAPGGAASSEYNVVFDAGFQSGFVAASGGDLSSVPSVVLASEQDREAFRAGFDAGYSSGSGATPAMPASVDPNAPVVPTSGAPVVPYGSSATGLNMTEAARLWEGNQRLAISLSGAAQPGTPGYAAISDMNFDPQNILVAAGVSTKDPAANWQNAMDMYYTMTRAGGSMPNAGALLTSMAYAEPGTEFDEAVREDPGAFYEIGMQVMIASGASGYAVNAFQQQMSRLYEAYGQYQLTSNSSDAILPFNQWLVAFHPNVVASWSEG